MDDFKPMDYPVVEPAKPAEQQLAEFCLSDVINTDRMIRNDDGSIAGAFTKTGSFLSVLQGGKQ